MRRTTTVTLALTTLLTTAGLAGATPSSAATPRLALKQVATLDSPVALATRKNDSAVWIAQQNGTVVRLVGSAVQRKLDVSSELLIGGEQGLLGMVFSRDGRHLYLDVTLNPDGRTEVWDYPVSPGGKIITGARRTILEQDQPYANHNGGNLVIGPDGYLYIGFGDGGSGGDPQQRAQNPSTWLGKILRIDPTRRSGGRNYSVPASNPFVHKAGYRPEIWIVGVRNPWRFSFDKTTGDLWIGDVGQDKYEEVDHLKATRGLNAGKGVNLGWGRYEGKHVYNPDAAVSSRTTGPVYEYTHDSGCAITGGYVYRGTKIRGLAGTYLFSDYCSGGIHTPGKTLLRDSANITSFGQGPDGELWVFSQDGRVRKLVAA